MHLIRHQEHNMKYLKMEFYLMKIKLKMEKSFIKNRLQMVNLLQVVFRIL